MASSLADIKARIGKLEDNLDAEAFISIYGRPKQGKTVLVAELAQALNPDGLPILFCDTNTSRLSLADKPELTQNVDFLDIEKPDDMAHIAHAVYTGANGFQDYSIVVVDEASTVAKQILEAYIREKNGLSATDPLPEFEGRDYAPATKMMESWMAALKNAPDVHVLLTWHERITVVQQEGEARKSTITQPDVWPGLMTAMNAQSQTIARITSDLVMKMGKPNYEREVQSLSTNTIIAGSRINLPLRADTEQWVDQVADFWLPAE